MTEDPSLAQIEEALNGLNLPPVADWSPTQIGDIHMTIRRDGSWWYRGSEIKRERMIKLFSTVLRRESDGRYALVTPVEKLYIDVEDAPFLAITMEIFGTASATTVTFETNVGDKVIVDTNHPIYVEYDQDENPLPYVLVRNQLPALLTRSVYYQLVDACVEREAECGIWSRDTFFSLGTLES